MDIVREGVNFLLKKKFKKSILPPSEVVGLNGSLVLAGLALVLSVINLDWNIFHTIQNYKISIVLYVAQVS